MLARREIQEGLGKFGKLLVELLLGCGGTLRSTMRAEQMCAFASISRLRKFSTTDNTTVVASLATDLLTSGKNEINVLVGDLVALRAENCIGTKLDHSHQLLGRQSCGKCNGGVRVLGIAGMARHQHRLDLIDYLCSAQSSGLAESPMRPNRVSTLHAQ
jgi:hypothetical protein